jgi:hypothetical protein
MPRPLREKIFNLWYKKPETKKKDSEPRAETQPITLNPTYLSGSDFRTRNPQPETRNPEPGTRNPELFLEIFPVFPDFVHLLGTISYAKGEQYADTSANGCASANGAATVAWVSRRIGRLG